LTSISLSNAVLPYKQIIMAIEETPKTRLHHRSIVAVGTWPWPVQSPEHALSDDSIPFFLGRRPRGWGVDCIPAAICIFWFPKLSACLLTTKVTLVFPIVPSLLVIWRRTLLWSCLLVSIVWIVGRCTVTKRSRNPTCPVHWSCTHALAATSTQTTEQEEEKNGADNDDSKKYPSSPVVPPRPTIVLVAILINANVVPVVVNELPC